MRVVLIGASGTFGARIARELAGEAYIALCLAGRRLAPLRALRDTLGDPSIDVATLDVGSDGFARELSGLRPQLVIHAAGPYQKQDYAVARACIDSGSHYVDLADARGFVTGIGDLDRAARTAGVLIVAGASTVPAVSAAAIDAVASRYSRIDAISHAIAPGNRTPRGEATVASILAMCGRPLDIWLNARMQKRFGWSMTRREHFDFGARWVSLCDVPDLSLFPERYRGVQEVVFRAGLELPVMHFATWALARLVRHGLIGDLPRWAPRLLRMSNAFLRAGSDVGGMCVDIVGYDTVGVPLHLRWDLVAGHGDGPQIPATPAVILARKLAGGELGRCGAMPCMGLFDLGEFSTALEGFDIRSRWSEVSR
jgi:saccharopine dehydrogenase-like NADP-dependent oxidoreductase